MTYNKMFKKIRFFFSDKKYTNTVHKNLSEPPQEPSSEIICNPTYTGGSAHNSVEK